MHVYHIRENTTYDIYIKIASSEPFLLGDLQLVFHRKSKVIFWKKEANQFYVTAIKDL